MKKILIVGKLKSKSGFAADGGRLKVSLYLKKLNDEGHMANLLELYHWFFHPLRIIYRLKKGFKSNDIILIMGGPKGCRPLIKLSNHFNKKFKKRVGFCPLGIGTLDHLLKNKNEKIKRDFMLCKDFHGIADDKMSLELKKLDFIMPQNEIILKAYQKFYSLYNNLFLVQNFRDVEHFYHPCNKSVKNIKLLFVSRITIDKGIIDLLEVIKTINKDCCLFSLDICGQMQLDSENQRYFYSFLDENIRYLGALPNQEIRERYGDYSFLVFPTKYYGEGTPGVVIESLIYGLPVLISDYSQATLLISEGYNGMIYEFDSKQNLYEKLMYISNNKESIKKMSRNAFESGEKYLYKNNREMFLKAIIGESNG